MPILVRDVGRTVGRAVRRDAWSRPAPCRVTPLLAAAGLAVLVAACGGGDTAGGDGLEVVRETRGDTMVVRTLGPADAGVRSLVEEVAIGELEGEDVYTFGDVAELVPLADGRVLVWDMQANALRMYGADGRHVRTVGRPGKGPGELEGSNGIAVLGDGRIGVWDPQNARLTVFAPDGDFIEEARLPGGFFTGGGSVNAVDPDAFWLRMPLGGSPGMSATPRPDGVRIVRLTNGAATPRIVAESALGQGDSILAPVQPDATNQLAATSPDGRGRTMTLVPFRANPVWAPGNGFFVSSPGGEYRIEIARPGQFVRIERDLPLIPVTDGERSAHDARVKFNMARTDPSWSWNGPAIPATKAAVRSLRVDPEGRIWVYLSQPGEEFTPEPPATENPNRAPALNWREPVAFDVFSPDGDFLGRLRFPQGTRSASIRGARGNQVWGVLPDSLGVDRVVRWRVEPGLARQ